MNLDVSLMKFHKGELFLLLDVEFCGGRLGVVKDNREEQAGFSQVRYFPSELKIFSTFVPDGIGQADPCWIEA